MNHPCVLVFAYEFPHRKSYDFILDLMALGMKPVVVAAPYRELGGVDRTQYFSRSLKFPEPIATKDVCAALDVDIFFCEHRNVDEISQIVERYSVTLGVIAGARIIPSSVINLFSDGIVNFHPGKIPETSGLDSLYYTIKNQVSAGVTAHFIDGKVDAGMHVFFEELEISLNETPETLVENIYQLQRIALKKFVRQYTSGSLIKEKIHRPHKNPPMEGQEKIDLLRRFDEWMRGVFIKQQLKKLHDSCLEGKVEQVRAIILRNPFLLEQSNEMGWTPLIVASFNQRVEVVKALLDLGADPNRGGLKGTTPLMYAKTKLIHAKGASYELLDILIRAGADVKRKDLLGRDIESYVEECGDADLLKKIRSLF